MMNQIKKFSYFSVALVVLFASGLFGNNSAKAAGISIDAGLTPSYHRLMVRSQMRYMHRNNHPMMSAMEMKTYMFPVMAAYGIRSDLTIIVRQAIINREMITAMGSSKNSGFGDLLILGKYRLARINKKNYTIGIAPTFGLEIPTGNDNFTSSSYDLYLGCLFSGRLRSFGADLNITYIWNGMALTGDEKLEPGDEFLIETALDYRFSFGDDANLSFAPVLESSYKKVSANSLNGENILDNGEELFFISPGFIFTRGSFILEGLVQFPLWQNQIGNQTERDTGFLIGFRLMN